MSSSAGDTTARPMSAGQRVALVAKREVRTRVRDRTYLISIGVFVLIIVAVIGINVIANRADSSYTVGVVDTLDADLEAAITTQAEAAGASVEFVSAPDTAAAEQQLADGDVDAVIEGDTLVRNDAFASDLSIIIDTAHHSVQVERKIAASGLDPGQLKDLLTVEPMKQRSLSAKSEDSMVDGIVALMAVGLGYGMLMMIVQFVAQGIVEEKSSRVVELLLAAVRPRQLLAGKVIGLGLLGLLQLVVVVGIGLAAAIWFDVVSIPASAIGTIAQVLAWYVLGYAFFATLTAAAASTVSRQEDLGSAMMPMTFIPLLAFFAAFKVFNDPTSPLSVAFSLIPGVSPTSMPVRAAVTEVPIWQYAVAIGLQLIAIYLLVRLAARIYTGAMLKTSGSMKYREAMARGRDGDLA